MAENEKGKLSFQNQGKDQEISSSVLKENEGKILNTVHLKLVNKLKAEEANMRPIEEVLLKGFAKLKNSNTINRGKIGIEGYEKNYLAAGIVQRVPTTQKLFDSLKIKASKKQDLTEAEKQRFKDLISQKAKAGGLSFESGAIEYMRSQTGGGRGVTGGSGAAKFTSQDEKLSNKIIKDLMAYAKQLGLNIFEGLSEEELRTALGITVDKDTLELRWRIWTGPKADIIGDSSIDIQKVITGEITLKDGPYVDELANAIALCHFSLKNKQELKYDFGDDSSLRRIEKLKVVFDDIGLEISDEQKKYNYALLFAAGKNANKTRATDDVNLHYSHLMEYYEVIGPGQTIVSGQFAGKGVSGRVNMILYSYSLSHNSNIYVRSAAGFVLDYINNKTLSWS